MAKHHVHRVIVVEDHFELRRLQGRGGIRAERAALQLHIQRRRDQDGIRKDSPDIAGVLKGLTSAQQ